MAIPVDVWVRGENDATTLEIAPVEREARAWTDADVSAVLEAMLRALDHASTPTSTSDRPIALRGFSWIVSPFEAGGVVIAIEMTLGAVVAGPFEVSEAELTAKIARVMQAHRPDPQTIH